MRDGLFFSLSLMDGPEFEAMVNAMGGEFANGVQQALANLVIVVLVIFVIAVLLLFLLCLCAGYAFGLGFGAATKPKHKVKQQ